MSEAQTRPHPAQKTSEQAELTWRAKLGDACPAHLTEEIDLFASQMALVKAGNMDEKLFMEARLRRGVYGQRYDNGQRHDGEETRTLAFPTPAFKGPDTHWDAPGMMRIKIPFGKMTAAQLEVLAECAEEYSDAILHVTTRQDIQLHFVHIEDTPDMMRRLSAVGITTREACGNSVRNVTACPYAGVCSDESFDVTPYANEYTQFFLGHPDVQDFGRKFKVAFSGCAQHACGLVNFHDLGAVAKVKDINGKRVRGFALYVGGGLGSVPQEARLIEEFLPEEELLPMAQAVSRVFARLGEKKNRAKARVKFLVKNLGTEAFTALVKEERAKLRTDPRWTAFLERLHATDETPIRPPGVLSATAMAQEDFARWYRSNVQAQAQDGYATVQVNLPLGDMTSDQARGVAELMRAFTGDTLRTTVEQNVMFRWVSLADTPALFEGLRALKLHASGANTLSDITSCPGTDTCKLGISASRGLAGELRKRLTVVQGGQVQNKALDPALEGLRIKTSGCFNSCGQHHVADLGFLGVSRNVGGRRVPHFQLVVGGEWQNNGGSYGLGIGAVPSKRVPEAVDRITQRFVSERHPEERFQDFIKRVGKAKVRSWIEDLTKVPKFDEDPSFYTDWGDTRVYTIGDMGVGECSGEVVPFALFGLQAAERQVFQAQELFDNGDPSGAHQLAYQAMLTSATSLIRHLAVEVTEDPDDVIACFRKHLYDTKAFHDPYAGAKFAQYFFRVHQASKQEESWTKEVVHQALEEAQLFIEASHACFDRLSQQAAS